MIFQRRSYICDSFDGSMLNSVRKSIIPKKPINQAILSKLLPQNPKFQMNVKLAEIIFIFDICLKLKKSDIVEILPIKIILFGFQTKIFKQTLFPQ